VTDAVVTIVRCGKCGRTGDLALRDNRFWCAWCQDWASLTAEAVENAIVEKGDGPPKLARRPPEWYPLQPLRIPTGWTVAYNNGLYEIDPSDESVSGVERWVVFKEDMLQMRNERRNRLLDLGWYPEGDLETGQYGLVVYEGDFDGRLLHEFRGRDRPALVEEIDRLLVAISEGKL
jgi:hypothetical protein